MHLGRKGHIESDSINQTKQNTAREKLCGEKKEIWNHYKKWLSLQNI